MLCHMSVLKSSVHQRQVVLFERYELPLEVMFDSKFKNHNSRHKTKFIRTYVHINVGEIPPKT